MQTFKDILGQTAALGVLRRAYLADRLPHAMIFAGPAGVGKGTTAAALAKLFLCEQPKDDFPCGKCESCTLFAAGNHPDHHVIYRQLARLEKEDRKARDISVDVIRQFLVTPAHLKPGMKRGKFFVVEEAELMNAAAQNSMLKTLEEPAGRTVIVLITDQPDALLPTIRSRCQVVRFAALDPKLVMSELRKRGIDPATATDAAKFAGGSLGVALRWIADEVVAPARELAQQLDGLLAGHAPEDLAAWFKSAAEAYAQKQLERDEKASKDQANREGLSIYLRIAAGHFRGQLTATSDSKSLEQACAAIDDLARAEMYVNANVSLSIIFQQLSMSLAGEYRAQ